MFLQERKKGKFRNLTPFFYDRKTTQSVKELNFFLTYRQTTATILQQQSIILPKKDFLKIEIAIKKILLHLSASGGAGKRSSKGRLSYFGSNDDGQKAKSQAFWPFQLLFSMNCSTMTFIFVFFPPLFYLGNSPKKRGYSHSSAESQNDLSLAYVFFGLPTTIKVCMKVGLENPLR